LRAADFASSRSGNRNTDFVTRLLALRFCFCFITRGLNRHRNDHAPAQVRSGLRVIRPGHWERAQISEMGIIGS
jgi:hypothetical protein